MWAQDSSDSESEQVEGERFQAYQPSKLQIGCAHPDPVVETASLAGVEPPAITYQLHLDDVVAQVRTCHTRVDRLRQSLLAPVSAGSTSCPACAGWAGSYNTCTLHGQGGGRAFSGGYLRSTCLAGRSACGHVCLGSFRRYRQRKHGSALALNDCIQYQTKVNNSSSKV